MKMNRLDDLYLDQLKDLYSAEKQLVQALPKMAKAANSDELRMGFQEHLEQTKNARQSAGADLCLARFEPGPQEVRSHGRSCQGRPGSD